MEASKAVKSDWRRHFDISYVQGAALIILGVVVLFQAADNLWITLIAAVLFALAAVGLIVHAQNRKSRP